jgi:hypothetical protein
VLDPTVQNKIAMAVLAKADGSIINRVEARGGTAADINEVRKLVAKAFTAKHAKVAKELF